MKIYVISIELDKEIKNSDLEFLESFGNTLKIMLQSIDSHQRSDEIVAASLEKIKTLCRKYSHRENYENFFYAVMDSIEKCYSQCNCYVGFPGFMARTIHYKLASKGSKMQGKILERSKEKRFASFEVLETLEKKILHHQDENSPVVLYHFGPSENFNYPFLALPLIVHQDHVVGVLGVDGIDESFGNYVFALRCMHFVYIYACVCVCVCLCIFIYYLYFARTIT